jgi:hypothetical protein
VRTHFQPELSWGAIRASINTARETFAPFGRQYVPTGDVSRLLQRWNVNVVLEDLPESLAAVLTPLAFGRRELLLSRSVPVESRHVVLLHEAGHLCQGTASLGVTYDNADWTTPTEQMADVFAAVALYPADMMERVLRERIWERDVEDEVAGYLRERAEGLWDDRRALTAARNRLRVRARLGL